MTPAEESAAIARLVAADPRFREDAYLLILDGCDLVAESRRKNFPPDAALSAVISAAEDKWSLLARTVAASLGFRTTADVCSAIANLANASVLLWTDGETPESFAAALADRDFGAELDACSLALFDVAPPRIVAGARPR